MKDKLTCNICGKSFTKSKSMTNHRRWHDLPKYITFQNKERKRMSIQSMGHEYNKGKKNALGYHHTHITKKQLSISHIGKNLGEKHPNWKGDKVGLGALHEWIKSRKPKPDRCKDCGKITTRLNLANISQKYLRDVNDFEWICYRCHVHKDGRIYNLKNQGNRNG